MRTLIALMLAGAAGLLAGCVYTGFYEANGASVTSPWSDSPTPHKVYFPYVLKYPDETDYFIPMWVGSEQPPHSDLALVSFDCNARSDGSLALTAYVRNQGSTVVPSIPFLDGFMGAFRVTAVVTTRDGERESIDGVRRTPLTVPDTVDIALGPTTRARASEVVGIDMVVDPDRVVPDPLRDNNVLSWKGAMLPANPVCSVVR
jgi:hypothetical protein